MLDIIPWSGGGYLSYFVDGMCAPFWASISPFYSSAGWYQETASSLISFSGTFCLFVCFPCLPICLMIPDKQEVRERYCKCFSSKKHFLWCDPSFRGAGSTWAAGAGAIAPPPCPHKNCSWNLFDFSIVLLWICFFLRCLVPRYLASNASERLCLLGT